MRIDFQEATPKHKRTNAETIFILVLLLICITCASVLYYKRNNNIGYNSGNNINDKEQSNTNIDKEVLNKEHKNDKIQNIYNSKTKIAYLTFDDGPSSKVTPLILDLLKERKIKATFFVLGKNIDNNPEILKRVYTEGHYIANHSYGHVYDDIYSKPENVLNEYYKTEKSIQKAIENTEYSSGLFRFPGGYSGSKYKQVKNLAAQMLNERNISYIDWNASVQDAARC